MAAEVEEQHGKTRTRILDGHIVITYLYSLDEVLLSNDIVQKDGER